MQLLSTGTKVSWCHRDHTNSSRQWLSNSKSFASIGRYVLTPDIFNILRHQPPGSGGEIQLADAINAQAQRGDVEAVRLKGLRFDCGSVPGFVEATNYVYENIYNPDKAWLY